MASQLPTVMTHSEATEMFTNEILPTITHFFEKDGEPDIVARSEGWSNWIDELHTDKLISDWQVANWEHPPCCD